VGAQINTKRARTLFFLMAYVFAGLAALTKGLIGIVFPAMIIGAWILLLNRWSLLKKMHIVSGMIIFLLITVPWYALVQRANPEFLHFFFVTQQVSRFLTTQDFNSKAVIWFYVPVLLAGFFPWSIFIIQAISQKIKRVWQDRQSYATELFLLLWFLIVFIFFSIPRSKTVGYILPIFPVMALLAGSYASECWERPKTRSMMIAMGVFISFCVVLAGVLIAAPYFNFVFNFPLQLLPYFRYMAMTLLVASVVCGCLWNRTTITLTPLFLTLTSMTGVLLLTFMAHADTINEKSIKPLAAELKSQLNPEDEVVTFYKYYQDLPIYLERRIIIVADWHASDIASKDNWVREMWYGMVFQDTKDWLIEEDAFWQRWNSNKRLYVLLDEDTYKKLNLKNNKKAYKISQHRHVVLMSNQPSLLAG
jgi:4-amino-4-deoxy-L-arabinose transferase-like glycosyltransferase